MSPTMLEKLRETAWLRRVRGVRWGEGTLMKAAVWGLMSAPCRVVSAVMKRAHPVRVFSPIPLFTSPHSFGT